MSAAKATRTDAYPSKPRSSTSSSTTSTTATSDYRLLPHAAPPPGDWPPGHRTHRCSSKPRAGDEASRSTNQTMRQSTSGQWKVDPDPQAAVAIDWAASLTEALAGAAANAG